MTQALSHLTPRHVLPMADTKTDTLVRAFTNRLEEGSDWRRRALPARLALTDEERQMMAARVEQIDRWLAPSRPAAIIRAVGLVRAGLATPVGSSDDVFQIYVNVLRPFPEPVVEDICNKFLDGRLGDRVYAPQAAQIAHECRLAVADALAERGRIMLVLDAEVYATPSEAEREEIKQKLADFLAETGAKAQGAVRDGRVTENGSAHADRLRAQSDLRDARERVEAQSKESAA
jgi:hypothetical protein